MVPNPYGWVRKQDPGGEHRAFDALRAVGLAVEAGHKLARDGGLANLTSIPDVRVAGNLQILDGGRWRAVRQLSLQLEKKDARAERMQQPQ
jgi:hypothetical protein